MNSQNNLNLIKRNLNEENNPISIITREFSDLDIQIWFKDEYDVIILNEAKNWTKFLKWFYPIAGVRPIFAKHSKKMMVVNTDLITRIPKEKSDKQKKKKNSVYNFVMHVKFSIDFPVILITEKAKKEYRMHLKPIVIGNVIDYTDSLYIVSQILYNTDVDEVIYALKQNGSYYDFIIPILNNHLQLYDPDYFSKEKLIKIYYKIRFEAKIDVIRNLLARSFKITRRSKVSFPVGYFKMFKYSKTTTKFMRSI